MSETEPRDKGVQPICRYQKCHFGGRDPLCRSWSALPGLGGSLRMVLHLLSTCSYRNNESSLYRRPGEWRRMAVEPRSADSTLRHRLCLFRCATTSLANIRRCPTFAHPLAS